MTATTLEAPATLAPEAPGPTLSLIYAADGWDWMESSPLEREVEIKFLENHRADHTPATVAEELKRIRRAAAIKEKTA